MAHYRQLLLAAPLLLAVSAVGATQTAASPGWTGVVLPQTAGAQAVAVGVAVGPDSLVAVGKTVCDEPRADTSSRCWGQPWVSTDGTAWQAVDPRTAGIDLGYNVPRTSGPDLGLAGIAYGPGGFVAFGRLQTDPHGEQVAALWRSPDGLSWQRVPDTAIGLTTATRLRTILGASDGYLLGGVTYNERAPRAAIWWSRDGVTWRAARGSGTFDIGGYIDTLEDPASGGINAFAVYPNGADGSSLFTSGAVAVGLACAPSFDSGIWAFNGYCWGQQWRSDEGTTWYRGDMPPTFGEVSSVATRSDRIMVDAPICPGCAPALLGSDYGTTWGVAYGSPVDGRLVALTSAADRFYALTVVEELASIDEPVEFLSLWVSEDGTNWQLDAAQPTHPVIMRSFHEVDMAVAGDHLVITAGGEIETDQQLASIALRGPALP